jgi:O-antigen/teichoic acid export membrane protein
VTAPGVGIRARRGAAALTTSQLVRQATQFVSVAILARLVAPAAFGVMSMALVVVALLALFRELGLGAAVIREPSLDATFLSTVFWTGLAASLLMATALVALSPLAAGWFGEPLLQPVLIGLAPTFVLSGAALVHQAMLERSMRFGSVAMAEVSSYLVGALAAIGMAIAGAGVWSLVGQTLVQALVSSAILVANARWVPRPEFERSQLKRVARFGGSLMLFNLVNFFSRNADNALIGRYIGSTQLGFYALAYRLMLYPVQTISTAAGRVMYPLLAELRSDREELHRRYLAMLGLIGFAAFPIGFGILAMSDRIVQVLLGAEWAPAAAPLAILAPVAVVQAVVTTIGALYMAEGRTGTMFGWGAMSTVLTVAGFAVGLRYGIVGVAASYLVTTLLLAYPALAIPYRLVGLRIASLLPVLGPSFLAGAAMFVLVHWASLAIAGPATDGAVFLSLIGLGVLAYGLASLLWNRRQLTQALSMRRLR